MLLERNELLEVSYTIKSIIKWQKIKAELSLTSKKTVKQFSFNNKNSIDLSSQAKGIYFVKIVTDKGSAIQKNVVE